MALFDPIVKSLTQINATFQLMLAEMKIQSGFLKVIAEDLKPSQPIAHLHFVLGKPSVAPKSNP